MKPYRNSLFILALFLLIGAGCSTRTDEALSTFRVDIVKSAENAFTYTTVLGTNLTDLQKLLDSTNVDYKTQYQDYEAITELDGVLTTAKKKWKLYINDTQVAYDKLTDVSVAPTDYIKWQYQ